MNNLIIEIGIIFIILYLVFILVNKYIKVDPIIGVIIIFIICIMYYNNKFIEYLENTGTNTKTEAITSIKANSEINTISTPEINNTIDNTISSNEIKHDDKTINTTSNNSNAETITESKQNTTITDTLNDIELKQKTFEVNNDNKNGTLKFFSDKNIKPNITGNSKINDTILNKADSNIYKTTTRNQFQANTDTTDNTNNTKLPSLEDISIDGIKADDIITNENKYTGYGGYIDANSLYVPRDYKYTNDDYGYNYIPPLNWIDLPDQNAPRVPLCVSANGNCLVKSSLTSGYPSDLKTWNQTRKVMGPAHIDTKYIESHLNTAISPDKINS